MDHTPITKRNRPLVASHVAPTTTRLPAIGRQRAPSPPAPAGAGGGGSRFSDDEDEDSDAERDHREFSRQVRLYGDAPTTLPPIGGASGGPTRFGGVGVTSVQLPSNHAPRPRVVLVGGAQRVAKPVPAHTVAWADLEPDVTPDEYAQKQRDEAQAELDVEDDIPVVERSLVLPPPGSRTDHRVAAFTLMTGDITSTGYFWEGKAKLAIKPAELAFIAHAIRKGGGKYRDALPLLKMVGGMTGRKMQAVRTETFANMVKVTMKPDAVALMLLECGVITTSPIPKASHVLVPFFQPPPTKLDDEELFVEFVAPEVEFSKSAIKPFSFPEVSLENCNPTYNNSGPNMGVVIVVKRLALGSATAIEAASEGQHTHITKEEVLKHSPLQKFAQDLTEAANENLLTSGSNVSSGLRMYRALKTVATAVKTIEGSPIPMRLNRGLIYQNESTPQDRDKFINFVLRAFGAPPNDHKWPFTFSDGPSFWENGCQRIPMDSAEAGQFASGVVIETRRYKTKRLMTIAPCMEFVKEVFGTGLHGKKEALKERIVKQWNELSDVYSITNALPKYEVIPLEKLIGLCKGGERKCPIVNGKVNPANVKHGISRNIYCTSTISMMLMSPIVAGFKKAVGEGPFDIPSEIKAGVIVTVLKDFNPYVDTNRIMQFVVSVMTWHQSGSRPSPTIWVLVYSDNIYVVEVNAVEAKWTSIDMTQMESCVTQAHARWVVAIAVEQLGKGGATVGTVGEVRVPDEFEFSGEDVAAWLQLSARACIRTIDGEAVMGKHLVRVRGQPSGSLLTWVYNTIGSLCIVHTFEHFLATGAKVTDLPDAMIKCAANAGFVAKRELDSVLFKGIDFSGDGVVELPGFYKLDLLGMDAAAVVIDGGTYFLPSLDKKRMMPSLMFDKSGQDSELNDSRVKDSLQADRPLAALALLSKYSSLACMSGADPITHLVATTLINTTIDSVPHALGKSFDELVETAAKSLKVQDLQDLADHAAESLAETAAIRVSRDQIGPLTTLYMDMAEGNVKSAGSMYQTIRVCLGVDLAMKFVDEYRNVFGGNTKLATVLAPPNVLDQLEIEYVLPTTDLRYAESVVEDVFERMGLTEGAVAATRRPHIPRREVTVQSDHDYLFTMRGLPVFDADLTSYRKDFEFPKDLTVDRFLRDSDFKRLEDLASTLLCPFTTMMQSQNLLYRGPSRPVLVFLFCMFRGTGPLFNAARDYMTRVVVSQLGDAGQQATVINKVRDVFATAMHKLSRIAVPYGEHEAPTSVDLGYVIGESVSAYIEMAFIKVRRERTFTLSVAQDHWTEATEQAEEVYHDLSPQAPAHIVAMAARYIVLAEFILQTFENARPAKEKRPVGKVTVKLDKAALKEKKKKGGRGTKAENRNATGRGRKEAGVNLMEQLTRDTGEDSDE